VRRSTALVLGKASYSEQFDCAGKFRLRSRKLYLYTNAPQSLDIPRFMTSFLDNLTLWTKSMRTFRRRHDLAIVPMRRKSDGDTLMKSVRACWPRSRGPHSRDPIAATGAVASVLHLSRLFPMQRMFGTKGAPGDCVRSRARAGPLLDEPLCPQRVLPSSPSRPRE
jgi:hypothetical protein